MLSYDDETDVDKTNAVELDCRVESKHMQSANAWCVILYSSSRNHDSNRLGVHCLHHVNGMILQNTSG